LEHRIDLLVLLLHHFIDGGIFIKERKLANNSDANFLIKKHLWRINRKKLKRIIHLYLEYIKKYLLIKHIQGIK